MSKKINKAVIKDYTCSELIMNAIKKDTVVCNPGILGSGILATNLFQKSNAVIQDYSKKLVEIYKNAQYKKFNGSLYNDTINKKQNIKILKSSLKITKHTENGFVQEITAKDNKWTGEEWKKIFALNSTNFYLENYNGKLRMVTVGKGHDMGMSLYGANALAEKQITAATILSYYYPGTKVVTPDLPQAK